VVQPRLHALVEWAGRQRTRLVGLPPDDPACRVVLLKSSTLEVATLSSPGVLPFLLFSLPGPSTGGGLVGLLGAARAICADAATYALSALSALLALSLFLIRKPAPEPRAEGPKMKRESADGFGLVVKHPILRNVVCSTAAVRGRHLLLAQGVDFNVAQVTYRQSITPPELLGRVNAGVRFITWGWMPVGVVVGGMLGTAVGPVRR
jgi:hypothetical protein